MFGDIIFTEEFYLIFFFFHSIDSRPEMNIKCKNGFKTENLNND
jgi:hypothetical protein